MIDLQIKPLVSIVIPVYNGSNYLKEAIESALGQTYENIEILVINDGSNDDNKTEDIAKLYGSKIKYFYKDNGGVSTALNLGIKNMKGDYFAWLSHDDIYDSENISTQVKNILNNQGGISVCKTGSLTGGKFYIPKSSGKIFTYDKPLDFWSQWFYACSILVPKEFLLSVDCINEKNKTAQDTELLLNLLSKYKMFFLDSPLVFRRVHSEQGFQTNSINNKMDSFNLLKNILRTKGICFFIDEKKTKNKLSLSFVYLFLAWEYQRDRRDIDNPIPKYILNTSTNEWPSLFNPCLYVSKSLFVFKQLVWRYYDVRKALSFLYKKLKN